MNMISTNYHQNASQIEQERAWVESAKDDPKEFAPIYEKYYSRILEFVYLRLDSKQEAYDVAQQVFLKALSKINQYEFRGLPFSSWLFRIAINELNQYFREKKKYRTINLETTSLIGFVEEIEFDEADPNMGKLRKALTTLSSMDFLLIEMRFFEKRAFAEIAQILEITENNAKVKTYRAIDRLRKAF